MSRSTGVAAGLVLALAACGSFDPDDGLALEPDARVYAAGEEYAVELRNGFHGPVSFGMCPSLCRQLGDKEEEQIPPSVPCPSVLLTLHPGESMTLSGTIPEDAEGEYRIGLQYSRDTRLEDLHDARSRTIEVR